MDTPLQQLQQDLEARYPGQLKMELDLAETPEAEHFLDISTLGRAGYLTVGDERGKLILVLPHHRPAGYGEGLDPEFLCPDYETLKSRIFTYLDPHLLEHPHEHRPGQQEG